MEEQGILIEILKQLQKKYGCMNRISDLTSEMQEALSRDDRVSASMLISMRQEEMDAVNSCDRDIHMLTSNLHVDIQEKVRVWIKQGTANDQDGFEGNKIAEISRNIKKVLEKTIAVDKMMSSRIAGKDSFY